MSERQTHSDMPIPALCFAGAQQPVEALTSGSEQE